MVAISFTLNGESRELDAEGTTPLLYVLRDQLSLNSPRYGCGKEQCGACRVVVDGELRYACTTPVEEVAGRAVMTVEGLADDELHPLQRGFLEHNAAQCGYCASGILMAAWRLLEDNQDPTREEIQSALNDNLCRCGSHNRIIRAIQRAAQIMRETS